MSFDPTMLTDPGEVGDGDATTMVGTSHSGEVGEGGGGDRLQISSWKLPIERWCAVSAARRIRLLSSFLNPAGARVLREEGRAELEQLATALLDLDTRIPSKLNWVCASMAIATRPIAVSSFKANWELFAARAISGCNI